MDVTPDGTESYRERMLAERNEQLRDLIRAISHDLRTPLSVAEGNAELARETGDLSRLETTSRALRRANELLDHLALLAKEEKRIHEPGPVGLREVADAAWGIVGTEEAALTTEGNVVLSADRQRFLQLFENLFDNALEHAGPDVTVSVGSLEEEGREGFFVEDDGPGIPDAERTEVFATGYTTDSEGRGFGLAICERIISAHGWDVEVTGGIDGGARFEVSDVETT